MAMEQIQNIRNSELSIRTQFLYRLDGLNDREYGLLLLSPLLLAIVAVLLYPFLRTLYISFYDLNIANPFASQSFVGIEHYISVIQDPLFQYAIGFTLFFAVVTVLFELILGLLCGLLLSRQFKGRALVRTAILLPWAIPLAVQGLLWKFIFNAQYGLANSVLLDFGILSKPLYWLGTRNTAVFALIFNDIWKTFPFMALLILAGIQSIDNDLYKASKVDGAGMWERFRYITLPLIKNQIFVGLIFRTIFALRVYGIIQIMTGGGPANGTVSVSILTIRRTFDQLSYGGGATVGVLTVIIMIPFIILYLYFYEGESS